MRISDWSSDVCSSDLGGGKFARGFGPIAGVAPGCVTAAEQGQQRQGGDRRAKHQSMSSTSTFSPVTFCDSAAAMKGSSAPSRTSPGAVEVTRSEEHTSELQSLMRLSYAVFCLQQKTTPTAHTKPPHDTH